MFQVEGKLSRIITLTNKCIYQEILTKQTKFDAELNHYQRVSSIAITLRIHLQHAWNTLCNQDSSKGSNEYQVNECINNNECKLLMNVSISRYKIALYSNKL